MSNKRSTKFSNDWVSDVDDGNIWLQASKKGANFFHCAVCDVDLSVANGGITLVKQHTLTKSHQNRLSARKKIVPLSSFFTSSSKKDNSHIDEDKKMCLTAEIRWTLHTIESNKSFHCEDKAAQLFRVMFPDSKIAASMTVGEDKVNYLCSYAVAPHMRKLISRELCDRYYSISFDESDAMMGVVVRSLDEKTGKVCVDFLDMIPMEEFNSEACVQYVLKAVNDAGLNFRNWIGEETDSCNTMRGAHNGAVTKIRKTPGLEHVINAGGCVLHIVANANKKACSGHFDFLSDFVDDIHSWINGSHKRSIALAKLQELLDYKQLKMKRNVDTRWLCLLPCLERIEEQWDVLRRLVSEWSDASDRRKRLLTDFNDPKTRISLKFVIFLMSFSRQFELCFQKSNDILIHSLRRQMQDLLLQLSVQFVRPDILSTTAVHRIDFNNHKNFLPLENGLNVGVEMTLIKKTLPDAARHSFLLEAREAFVRLANYLKVNLPFKKKILKSLQFLDITNGQKLVEKLVLDMARNLPNVIPERNSTELQTEVRIFNLLTADERSMDGGGNGKSIAQLWHEVRCMMLSNGSQIRFPLLGRLSAACSTLFHGNADIERMFSKVHDISNAKRNRLSDDTEISLTLVKAYMNSHELNASSFPVNDELLSLGMKARAEYHAHLKKVADEKKQKKIERAKEEEQKRMKATIDADKERKKHLECLEKKKVEHEKKMNDAAAKRLEAELAVQSALKNLASATAAEKDVTSEASSFIDEKHRIEREAAERALKTAAENVTRLKRQAEDLRIQSLPKFQRK